MIKIKIDMNNDVMNGVMVWYQARLEAFIEKMGPNGTYFNNHTDQFEKADGVVILACGEVCPVSASSSVSLNPLYFGDSGNIELSCSSVAGQFYNSKRTLHANVKEYNDTLLKNKESAPGYMRNLVVGYNSFKELW